MKRFILVGVIFSTLAFTYRIISNHPSLPVTDLPLNWEAPIGNVSFRTNVDLIDNQIVIGSNGGNYMDYFSDKGNGIYLLDPKTGKTQLNFANESFGDMDVNGVLVYNNNIYFGNDNDEIICANKNGKILFRQDASGDIEHRPILIKTPSSDQIVFAMETGEIRCIDPKDGKINWTYYHPQFEGQKVGDNRTVFKLKMHFYSGEKFFLEPIISDLNNDGVSDLIYVADMTDIYAVDGKTGKLITSIIDQSSDTYYGSFQCALYRSQPGVISVGKQKLIVIPYTKYFANDSKGEKAVKELRFFNSSGNEVKRITVDNEANIDRIQQIGNRLFFGNRWMDFSNGLDNYSIYSYDQKIKNYGFPRIAKNTLTINGDECVVLSFEYGFRSSNEYYTNDKSSIGIYNLSKKRFESLHDLNSTSEFVPILGDFNQDNKVDLLLGCHDGKLYNLNLDYPASSINY